MMNKKKRQSAAGRVSALLKMVAEAAQ